MKKHLIYFVAFGEDCWRQLQLCLSSLKVEGEFDILVITDDIFYSYPYGIFNYPKIRYWNLESKNLINTSDKYAYRANLKDCAELKHYKGVLYLDCDFIFKGSVNLDKFNDAIYLCEETHMRIDHHFMKRNLTKDEVKQNWERLAINSGAYYVPESHYDFFDSWRKQISEYSLTKSVEDYCPEQTILNSMYIRKEFDFKLFEKDFINFPAYKASINNENTKLFHLSGIGIPNKIKLMQQLSKNA